MNYFLGIDAGSSYIKFVIINEQDSIIARHIINRRYDISQSVNDNYNLILEKNEIHPENIKNIVATGYGRRQIKNCNNIITEITALGIGCYKINSYIRTIIDIGGQDSKIITLDEKGKILNFVMNQKCSAGTGKFLEVIASSMGIEIEKFCLLSEQSKEKFHLSSSCTVFTETEIISLLSKGKRKEDIIFSLHNNICKQITSLIFQLGVTVKDAICFVGGVALNKAIVSSLSKMINRQIITYEYPQFYASYGAAIHAKNLYLPV